MPAHVPAIPDRAMSPDISPDIPPDIPLSLAPVVLIVEDECAIRLLLAQLFALRGCIVFTARTLSDGVRALAHPTRVFDLVVLDLDLPDGRGETILAVARNTPRMADAGLPRMVVHSGSSDGDRMAGLMGCGAHAVVGKPSAFGDLWDGCFPG